MKLNASIMVILISNFTFSHFSFSDEIVKSIDLNLNSETVRINVFKNKNNKYFFEEKFDGLYKKLGGSSQAYPIKTNRSVYYPNVINSIDYEFFILNMDKNIYYPLLEKEYPLSNSMDCQLNSIIISTYQEDNGEYNFVFKYDYYPVYNSIKLSSLLYVEKLMEEESDHVTYYKVNETIPDYINDLSNYNSEKYSKFIINELYGKNNNLSLDVSKIKEYQIE